jgi:hypothetical protein
MRQLFSLVKFLARVLLVLCVVLALDKFLSAIALSGNQVWVLEFDE